MIYRVTFDGIDIYGPKQDMNIISPVVKTEINNAGSFDFTLPPNHLFYDMIVKLKTTVAVYEKIKSPSYNYIITSDESPQEGNVYYILDNGEYVVFSGQSFEEGVDYYERELVYQDDWSLIFLGRPSEINYDFYNRKKIHCEGALAYFNDTIQRPATYTNIRIRDFLQNLITEHNSQVDISRQFTLGTVNFENYVAYRKLNYENTFNCISSMCLDTTGGYLFVRHENDINYLDWYRYMPYESTQTINYSINLTSLTQDINVENICTVIIPLGAEDENGEKLTIKSVNNNIDYLVNEAYQDIYGNIVKVVEFSDITDPSVLLSEARAYISNQTFNDVTIEVDAVDLHLLNPSVSVFKVGQTVQITSAPHNVNFTLPLTKIEVSLDTAVKSITIGTIKEKELTEIYDSKTNTSSPRTQESGFVETSSLTTSELNTTNVVSSSTYKTLSYDSSIYSIDFNGVITIQANTNSLFAELPFNTTTRIKELYLGGQSVTMRIDNNSVYLNSANAINNQNVYISEMFTR